MGYRSTSVRAVIRSGTRILVERLDAKRICFLPGGTVEAGESLVAALERELREELGCQKIIVGRYRGRIGHIWLTNGTKDSCLNHYFDVEIPSHAPILANEKGRVIDWIDLESLDSEILQPPSLRALLLANSGVLWDQVESDD